MKTIQGHIDGSRLEADPQLECDCLIVGTGAGGGVSAEILARAGLRVILLEEGPYRSREDFHMREQEAYPDLYQEAAGRRTSDKAIQILQGKGVGGSTTVNWTSSFRTPEQTLETWTRDFGVQGCSAEELAPWFARMEKRLHISPWTVAPNANNDALARGCRALGWNAKVIPRNVLGCANLGYCGTGCPIDAKQSMLVTTIPAALKAGARLVSRARAERLVIKGDRVTGAQVTLMDDYGQPRARKGIRIRARHTLVAAGAIGSPALLLRSKAPDPHARLGKRTFLHPVAACAGLMPEPVKGYAGAPQSIYSDEFLWPASGAGYKLEVAPVHPVLMATLLTRHGQAHTELMASFSHTQATLALLRDGFHEQSPGGRVRLDPYGYPSLDYPISDYLWDGVRRSLLTMAELLFAAGAARVMPLHLDAEPYRSFRDARRAIGELAMQPLKAQLFSAHVMGGCAMGDDARNAVTDSAGRHHQLESLHIIDGSLFPTSIGANPQLSIYALAGKLATALADDLAGGVQTDLAATHNSPTITG